MFSPHIGASLQGSRGTLVTYCPVQRFCDSMRTLWDTEVMAGGAHSTLDSSYIQQRPSVVTLDGCVFSDWHIQTHFIRDKSKKTWQMVTVPCLDFFFKRIKNGCLRSLPGNHSYPPPIFQTQRCKHSHVHSYTLSTEAITHGQIVWHAHIHTRTWVRDQTNVRGK